LDEEEGTADAEFEARDIDEILRRKHMSLVGKGGGVGRKGRVERGRRRGIEGEVLERIRVRRRRVQFR